MPSRFLQYGVRDRLMSSAETGRATCSLDVPVLGAVRIVGLERGRGRSRAAVHILSRGFC
jgi:hypothetical protein